MKTKEIGDLGEKIAETYLKKNGYKIVAKNQHQSHNELDLIVTDSQYIVFVEVKTRSTEQDLFSPYGSPASAVDWKKQQRLIQAAKSYLAQSKAYGKQPRFDVIEVYLKKGSREVLHIHYIPDAFTK
ncbi:MAG: YraN family protein [Clostridia bacterium]|nr:YraN family protein [Clostridia bacterium]